MEPIAVAILAGAAVNAVVVLGGLALWFGYRARRAQRPDQPEPLGGALEARLAELTRAVDAVAIEVERLGETQRYLALQRRAGVSPPVDAPAPRIITPH